MLAYTTGRRFLELGRHSGDPSVYSIADSEPGGENAPTSFYLENSHGQRSGWINGEAVNELPEAFAGEDEPWGTQVGATEPSIDPSPEPEPRGPFPRFISISEPSTELALHVVGGTGDKYALSAEDWSEGAPTDHEELKGGATGNIVVSSPALQAIAHATTSGENPGRATPGITPPQLGTSYPLPRVQSPGHEASSAAIRSALAREIVPSGKQARTATLARRGRYTLTIGSLEAGEVAVSWYEAHLGAKMAAKGSQKPILIAVGHARFRADETQRVTMKLTAAGQRLLRHSRHVDLIAKGSFTPNGRPAITVTRQFTVSR